LLLVAAALLPAGASAECAPEPQPACFVYFEAPLTDDPPQSWMRVIGSWANFDPNPIGGSFEMVLDGEQWVGAGYFEDGLTIDYKILTKWPGKTELWCVVSDDGEYDCTGGIAPMTLTVTCPMTECPPEPQCDPPCVFGEVCEDGSCVAVPCDPPCTDGETCALGICQPAPGCLIDCTFPDGTTKGCGPNGCGGSCGACGTGLVCDGGTCVPPALAPEVEPVEPMSEAEPSDAPDTPLRVEMPAAELAAVENDPMAEPEPSAPEPSAEVSGAELVAPSCPAGTFREGAVCIEEREVVVETDGGCQAGQGPGGSGGAWLLLALLGWLFRRRMVGWVSRVGFVYLMALVVGCAGDDPPPDVPIDDLGVVDIGIEDAGVDSAEEVSDTPTVPDTGPDDAAETSDETLDAEDATDGAEDDAADGADAVESVCGPFCPEGYCDELTEQCEYCVIHTDCPGHNRWCLDHRCVQTECVPGSTTCFDENTLQACDVDGYGWEVKGPCVEDHVCSKGKCLPVVCTPGDAVCDEQHGPRCCFLLQHPFRQV